MSSQPDPSGRDPHLQTMEELLAVATNVCEELRRASQQHRLSAQSASQDLQIAEEYLRVLQSSTTALEALRAEQGAGYEAALLRARAHLVSAGAFARMQELAKRNALKEDPEGKQPRHFWLEVFNSRSIQNGMMRASMIGVALLFLVFLVVIISLAILKCQLGEVSVTVTEDNRLEIISPGRKITWYLLSATGEDSTSPWMDTGITVKQGECYDITASGRINIGIHKLLDAAVSDEKPRFPWSGPEGTEVGTEYICNKRTLRERIVDTIRDLTGPQDDKGMTSSTYRSGPCREDRTASARYNLREPLFIARDHRLGRVLGQISPAGKTPALRFDESSERFIDINSRLKNWKSPLSGKLWVTVNDLWLDDASIDTIPEEDRIKAEIGEEIRLHKELNYSRIWYDDNVGFFFLVVESRAGC